MKETSGMHETQILYDENSTIEEEITTKPPLAQISIEITDDLNQRQQQLKGKIMIHAQSSAERQRLPALKMVPKKDLAPIMKDVNTILATIPITSLEQTNQLAYSTAVIVTEELGIQKNKPKGPAKSTPKWKI